jgi:hypothetical protein
VAAADVVEVWPDNWPAVRLFVDLTTQWRVSMGVRIGVDYAAIIPVMTLRGIEESKRSALFDDIRVMEAAALESIRGTQ